MHAHKVQNVVSCVLRLLCAPAPTRPDSGMICACMQQADTCTRGQAKKEAAAREKECMEARKKVDAQAQQINVLKVHTVAS